jgi:hypothetical protein
LEFDHDPGQRYTHEQIHVHTHAHAHTQTHTEHKHNFTHTFKRSGPLTSARYAPGCPRKRSQMHKNGRALPRRVCHSSRAAALLQDLPPLPPLTAMACLLVPPLLLLALACLLVQALALVRLQGHVYECCKSVFVCVSVPKCYVCVSECCVYVHVLVSRCACWCV